MMLFTKNSAGGFTSIAKLLNGPFDQALGADQTELAVPTGAVPVQLVAPFSNTRAYAVLRNTSAAAQLIRFSSGANPSFTGTVTGQLLPPGAQIVLPDIRIAVLGIADVGGALCSRYIVRSSGI